MSENTKEKTYYVIVYLAGGEAFITNPIEKKRYYSGLVRAAEAYSVKIKMFEYHADSAYIILGAKSTKTATEVIHTANHSYCSHISMKEGDAYFKRFFGKISPICLTSREQESMIRTGLYLSMRF